MSRSFTFKKFTVSQENAAFKVGTDSVVLGAWTNINPANNILDIGTGTGLLALMCAQRNTTANIIAIEKDEASYTDASDNFLQSTWADRISAFHTSLDNFSSNTAFDYIICNPPYFLEALLPVDERKADARHAGENWFSSLAQKANILSSNQGVFGCVLPQKEFDYLHAEFSKINWQLIRTQKLLPYPGGDKIRVLAEWRKQAQETQILPDICVRNESREFSDEYKSLTKDFYLKF